MYRTGVKRCLEPAGRFSVRNRRSRCTTARQPIIFRVPYPMAAFGLPHIINFRFEENSPAAVHGRRLPVGAGAARQPSADLLNIFPRLLSANVGKCGSRPIPAIHAVRNSLANDRSQGAADVARSRKRGEEISDADRLYGRFRNHFSAIQQRCGSWCDSRFRRGDPSSTASGSAPRHPVPARGWINALRAREPSLFAHGRLASAVGR